GALGVRALIVTNAAGSCNPSFAPGDLMRITDHINFTGRNPLTGANEGRLGPRLPDLTHAYDARLATALEEAARSVGQTLRAGVYLQMNGPSYETAAEVRMARTLGADAIGMSTVPEVIAAAHQGVPVAGISCITNLAAGISQHPLTHQEVVEVARAVEGKFVDLLRAFVPRAFAAVLARRALRCNASRRARSARYKGAPRRPAAGAGRCSQSPGRAERGCSPPRAAGVASPPTWRDCFPKPSVPRTWLRGRGGTRHDRATGHDAHPTR